MTTKEELDMLKEIPLKKGDLVIVDEDRDINLALILALYHNKDFAVVTPLITYCPVSIDFQKIVRKVGHINMEKELSRIRESNLLEYTKALVKMTKYEEEMKELDEKIGLGENRAHEDNIHSRYIVKEISGYGLEG